MQIHKLDSNYKMKKKRRVGRGGNRATYAGRGRDGQKSRSGGKKGLVVKVGRKGGYFKSMPLLGGFKPNDRDDSAILNIEQLDQRISDFKDIVSVEKLIKKEIVPKATRGVKVVGGKKEYKIKNMDIGKIKFGKGISFSASVKKLLNLEEKKTKEKK